MKFLPPTLVLIVATALTGCTTLIEKKDDYNVSQRLKRYYVNSVDGSLAVKVSKQVGAYNKNPYTRDACFINHEYLPKCSYAARIGIAVETGTSTGVRLMTEEDKKHMTSVDGEPKLITSQHLGSALGWDLLYYSYRSKFEYKGVTSYDCTQVLLAMKRIGNHVAHIEQYLSHWGECDTNDEQELTKMLGDYEIVTR